jgi:hypothetical protein
LKNKNGRWPIFFLIKYNKDLLRQDKLKKIGRQLQKENMRNGRLPQKIYLNGRNLKRK